MTNKVQAALEVRKALQFYLETLDIDTQSEKILEVPSVFPKYEIGKTYKTKEIFGYGENSVGDVQLYQVLQDHISAEEWLPETATSLYKKIGVTEDGVSIWVQPLGVSDAYMLGDKVSYKDTIWESDVDNNVWEPGVYGWKEVTE